LTAKVKGLFPGEEENGGFIDYLTICYSKLRFDKGMERKEGETRNEVTQFRETEGGER